MKKIIATIAMVLMICFLFSACAKKAEPIVMPDLADINFIQVVTDTQSHKNNDNVWISGLIAKIAQSKSTSKASVQDVPNGSDYIAINVTLNNGKTSTVFFYR
jgi:starvation-inducible outer membrane lipoprotein